MPDGYFTASNHLSQDLADALMNVWLATRDPDVAEALGHQRDYKGGDAIGPIQGIEIAASVAEGRADDFLKYKFPGLNPSALSPYYPGLFDEKPARLAPMTMVWRGFIIREWPRRRSLGSFRGVLLATRWAALTDR